MIHLYCLYLYDTKRESLYFLTKYKTIYMKLLTQKNKTNRFKIEEKNNFSMHIYTCRHLNFLKKNFNRMEIIYNY